MDRNDFYNNNHKIDIYHFGYDMMVSAFQVENINVGIKKALYLAKVAMQANDIVMYKKDIFDDYGIYTKASLSKEKNMWLNHLVNRSKSLLCNKDMIEFDCSDIDETKSIMLLPLVIHDNEYLFAIKDYGLSKTKENEKVISIFKDTMKIILDHLEKISEMNIASYKDKLTGLYNRNEYEKDISELNNIHEPFTYILLDLFRLKYLNDNYDYLVGDSYIVKTAEALKKYFPEFCISKDEEGNINKKATGNFIYRIGGDEFVIISRKESLATIQNKMEFLQAEIENLNLNVEDKLLLGINYGIAIKENDETIKELTIIADEELKDNKTLMYKRYGIERRK